jgi:hypothetical protein
MPKVQELKVKNGAEYWTLLEKTARRVESWPEWKTGEPAIISPLETNASKLGRSNKPKDPNVINPSRR